MLAKRTNFGVFVEGDGRTQCASIAKATGVRCMANAIRGAAHCKRHGGIAGALKKAKARGEKITRNSPDYAVKAMRFKARLSEGELTQTLRLQAKNDNE
jgi:hypothetical protein